MKNNDFHILIPARKGSKGFPLKNRKLFKYTVDTIPEEFKHLVYVSTDDEVISQYSVDSGVNVIDRPPHLGQDETSMKDVLLHFIEEKNIKSNIILLYLTYPQRTWDDIQTIYDIFLNCGQDSLACSEKVSEHPYLCFYKKDNNRGKLLIDHKLYRRQDYPECFKLSMFVACYTPDAVDKLHCLMFKEDTHFHQLSSHKVDVDYIDQFLAVSDK